MRYVSSRQWRNAETCEEMVSVVLAVDDEDRDYHKDRHVLGIKLGGLAHSCAMDVTLEKRLDSRPKPSLSAGTRRYRLFRGAQ